MKKESKWQLQIIRWLLIALFFGMMGFGFFLIYQRSVLQNRVPKIETSFETESTEVRK